VEVYATNYSDEVKFHPFIRRPICSNYKDCLVIELTFRDIYEAVNNENHILKRYVPEYIWQSYLNFYEFAKVVTPEHVGLDDKVFIVLEDVDGDDWMRNSVDAYILFGHFEHSSSRSIMKLLLHLTDLCEKTMCMYTHLEEMSSNMEYILFRLEYSTMDREVNNKIYQKPNPWRQLISAFLQDYYIYRGYVQIVFEGVKKHDKRLIIWKS